MPALRLSVLLVALLLATPSFAARCGGDFDTFLAGITDDMAVLNFDRLQRGTFDRSCAPGAAVVS